MSIKRFIEDGVESFEAKIDGETIQWDKGLSYARHLQTDALLNAQILVSDKPDEMLFIIMHQTMELWLKLVLHEAKLAVGAIQSDNLDAAFKTLDRIATIQRHMINSWEVLATLTPHDFMTFRGFLRKASGFQSWQYRELEFLLGNKREDLTIVHQEDGEIHQHLMAALATPSLYDEVLRLLARRGFAIPASHIDRDWTKPYPANDAVENVWLEIYSDVETHWDLFTLQAPQDGVPRDRPQARHRRLVRRQLSAEGLVAELLPGALVHAHAHVCPPRGRQLRGSGLSRGTHLRYLADTPAEPARLAGRAAAFTHAPRLDWPGLPGQRLRHQCPAPCR
jgi:tryptophan 2,3-dioxygenase